MVKFSRKNDVTEDVSDSLSIAIPTSSSLVEAKVENILKDLVSSKYRTSSVFSLAPRSVKMTICPET